MEPFSPSIPMEILMEMDGTTTEPLSLDDIVDTLKQLIAELEDSTTTLTQTDDIISRSSRHMAHGFRLMRLRLSEKDGEDPKVKMKKEELKMIEESFSMLMKGWEEERQKLMSVQKIMQMDGATTEPLPLPLPLDDEADTLKQLIAELEDSTTTSTQRDDIICRSARHMAHGFRKMSLLLSEKDGEDPKVKMMKEKLKMIEERHSMLMKGWEEAKKERQRKLMSVQKEPMKRIGGLQRLQHDLQRLSLNPRSDPY